MNQGARKLQISADNGIFGQTGPKVGSFDAGYGSSHMARLVGESSPAIMSLSVQETRTSRWNDRR